jgi:hypothetical protein
LSSSIIIVVVVAPRPLSSFGSPCTGMYPCLGKMSAPLPECPRSRVSQEQSVLGAECPRSRVS